MNNVKISIEMRIEAGTESEARQYAAMHSIDVTLARWHRNSDCNGGRLYVVASTPLCAVQCSHNAAEGLHDSHAAGNSSCFNRPSEGLRRNPN
jgi:hypothetical protein